MQCLALKYHINELYILKELGFEKPVNPVHAHKMEPGHTGINTYYCSTPIFNGNHDQLVYAIQNNKFKQIYFITCKRCNIPIRIQIQLRFDEYASGPKNYWWHTIEPMFWFNGFHWTCTDCLKNTRNTRIATEEEIKRYEYESKNLHNIGPRTVHLVDLCSKSKPYDHEDTEFVSYRYS
jgi:hypothetical protein